jgi:hypothetical protein
MWILSLQRWNSRCWIWINRYIISCKYVLPLFSFLSITHCFKQENLAFFVFDSYINVKPCRGLRIHSCSNAQLSIFTCNWHSSTLRQFSRVIPIFTCQLPFHKSSINLIGDITNWFTLTAQRTAHFPRSSRIYISETTEGELRKFNIRHLNSMIYWSRLHFVYRRQNVRHSNLPCGRPGSKYLIFRCWGEAARPWRWFITWIYCRD